MTEEAKPPVLTARRAPQHVRLFGDLRRLQAFVYSDQYHQASPRLRLMLADTPSPHGSGATLASVGTLSEGFERSVASPLQPRRLRAMGRTV
jgi:hypothetical protein